MTLEILGWIFRIKEKENIGLIIFIGDENFGIAVFNRFCICCQFLEAVLPCVGIILRIMNVIFMQISGKLPAVNGKI